MLDQAKRQKIIALLANGSSRRMAARYVRCSPSTIARTAAADQVFADQLAAAESSAEIDALRAVRAAFRKDRYSHRLPGSSNAKILKTLPAVPLPSLPAKKSVRSFL